MIPASQLRLWLGVAGLIAAAVAVAADSHAAAWVAIILLVAAFLFRLALRRRLRSPDEGDQA